MVGLKSKEVGLVSDVHNSQGDFRWIRRGKPRRSLFRTKEKALLSSQDSTPREGMERGHCGSLGRWQI